MPWVRNSNFYFTPASSENLNQKNSTLSDKIPVLTRLRSYLKSPPKNGGSTTTDGNLGSTNNLARQFFASIRRVFKSEKPPSTNTFQVLSTPSKTTMTSQAVSTDKAVSTAAKNILSIESPSGKGVADQELTKGEKFIQGALEEVINTEETYQKRLDVLIQLKEILDDLETKAKLESCLKTHEERVLYDSFMDFFSGDDLYVIKNESGKILKNLNDDAKKLNSPSRNDRMEAVKDMGREMEGLCAIQKNYEKLATSHLIFEARKFKFQERTSTEFEFNKELISQYNAILKDKEIKYDENNDNQKMVDMQMSHLQTLKMQPIQRLMRYYMPWKEVLKAIEKDTIFDETFQGHIQKSTNKLIEISQLSNQGVESKIILMDILDILERANTEEKNINVDKNGKLILKKDILINLMPKAAKEKADLAMKMILSDLNKIVDSQEFINQTEVKNALKMLENLKQMKKAVTVHRSEIQALKAKIDSF